MKKLFCCPALELFHCLPLWKTVLFVSSRAFLLSTPTFLFSTPMENSEATWKKATKCNKRKFKRHYKKKAKEKVTKNKIFLVIFMKFGTRKRVNKLNLLTPQEL